MLISLFVIMTIAACGNKDQDINTGIEEPIELRFYYPVQVGGPLTNFIETLVEEFEDENPHIIIKPLYTGNYADTATKIKKAKDDDSGPDFFVSLASDRFSMIDMDYIEPLDGFIASDIDREYIQGFLPEFMEDSRAHGQTWSIPFQRSTQLLYYNKEAFRQAGLDPETPPVSWDELARYAQELVKKDEVGNVTQWGLGMALNKSTAHWSFSGFSLQNSLSDGNIMSDNGKMVFFDTPENVEILEFWRDLREKYMVMPDEIIEWSDLPHHFLNGKYAMIYNTTGNLTHIFKNTGFEFGTAYLPGNRQMGTTIGGGNFYISKDSSQAKKEAAWEFIKFATRTDKVVEWSINTGYIPTRAEAFESDLMKKYYEEIPQAIVPVKQLEYAKPELATYGLEEMWEILNNAIHLALNDRLAPDKALRAAQEDADELLKRYK